MKKNKDTDLIIKELKGGGYSFRFYMKNLLTGEPEQITRQNRKWTREEAENEYYKIKLQGSSYFTFKNAKVIPYYDEQPKPNFGTLYFYYIRDRIIHAKPSTVNEARTQYKAFIKPFFDYEKTDELTQKKLNTWRSFVINHTRKTPPYRTISPITKNHIITIFNNLIRFAHEFDKNPPYDYLRFNIPQGISVERVEISSKDKSKRRTYWKRKDWDKFLEMIPETNIQDRAIFYTLLFTSMRVGELRFIKAHSIDIEDGRIEIEGNIGRQSLEIDGASWIETTTKTGDGRHVYLDESIMKHLEAWIKECRKREKYNPYEDYLFSVNNGRTPISINTIRKRFNEYKRAMKIKYPDMDGSVILHGLRHSSITYFAREVDVQEAMLIAGHKSAATTALYTHGNMKKSTAKKVALGELKDK